jgi:hypothetical protein
MAFDPGVAAAHLMAAAGPVTSLGEWAATSVAAGMLLGGFVAGAFATAAGWDPYRRDGFAVSSGYLGGLAMAIALLGEATMR